MTVFVTSVFCCIFENLLEHTYAVNVVSSLV